MADPFTWAAIIGVVVSAVGAGVSYSAQQSAAADNAQLALLNAQAQTQAAQQAGELGAMQGAINSQLASKDAEAAEASARALEAQAAIGTDISQQNIRKTREEFARLLAAQRVQAAKAGVADTTGSPLELLANTAAEEQRQADILRYEDEENRRGLFQGAQEQRNQGIMARINGLSQQSQGAAARGGAMAQIAQAKLDLYGARAQSRAMRNQATGSLISSAGSIAQSAYSTYRAAPRSSGLPSSGHNISQRPYIS